MTEEKPYLICCGHHGRAVLIGYSTTEPMAGQPITMSRVRMVLWWDSECGGLLGLAADGPKGKTRITPAVERHGDERVRQWVAVSTTAMRRVEAWPSC